MRDNWKVYGIPVQSKGAPGSQVEAVPGSEALRCDEHGPQRGERESAVAASVAAMEARRTTGGGGGGGGALEAGYSGQPAMPERPTSFPD